jgi:hypothetical protein
MWEISEGLFVIIAIIFLFGVLSLPPRHKKARPLDDRDVFAEDAMAQVEKNTSKAAIEQASLGKGPRDYSGDQKTAKAPSTR